MGTTAPHRGKSDARRAQSSRRYLRFMPAIRSAYVERFRGAPESTTLYLDAEYFDESLIEYPSYQQARRRDVIHAILHWDYGALALPEPFWIAQLPFVTLLSLTARLRALLTRRRLEIVTYAIENAEPALLLGLPKTLPAKVRRHLLSIAVLPYVCTLDRIAFGTDGARLSYLEGLGGLPRSRLAARSRTFEPLAPACECDESVDKVANSVLFLGPLETRKGLDTLLEIWPDVVREVPNAVLTICGSGPLRHAVELAAEERASLRFVEQASRAEMHRLLAESEVLVSLPRPSRRWREQIGLSVTEGLSHGCHIVTTDQTGLASWLRNHAQTVVPPGDAEAAKRGLVHAAGNRLAGARTALPSVGGRVQAERWMSGEPGE